MKWLIATLLLVNLAIFVWHYQGEHRTSGYKLDDETSQLVLLKEYLEQHDSSTADNQSGQSMCYTLGPFSKKASAKKVQAKLKKVKVNANRRVSNDSVQTGYWVLIPPSKSSKAAAKLLTELKSKNVADFFLVATGEQTNAISLGVFSKSKLARARLEDVNKLGFKAKVIKISLPKRVYWLDWNKQAAKQPPAKMLENLREEFNGIGQAERRCKIS
ncbi:MAG: SPOR domain-containing protein [Gammaproteobacteria bacterium]|nr:SPOR domain-containing protein [Gammaproteobacteria bacterium]